MTGIFKAQATMPCQTLRIAAAVGHQPVPIGRRCSGRRSDHMGQQLDLITRQNLRQDSCHQGAVGVINLVKIMQLMRLAGGQALAFGLGPEA